MVTDKADCLVSDATNANCLLCKPQYVLTGGACSEVTNCYRMGSDNKCLNCVDGYTYTSATVLDTAG
jgi:hypothetical protein